MNKICCSKKELKFIPFIIFLICCTSLVIWNYGWHRVGINVPIRDIGLQRQPANASLKTTKTKWADILMRQSKRLNQLQTQCQELGLNTNTNKLTQVQLESLDMMVDDAHHVLLKAIPKTGCTSWRSLLIDNSLVQGRNVTTFEKKHYGLIGLGLLHKSSRPLVEHKLRDYYSIITVRHPFKRLESVFRWFIMGAKRRIGARNWTRQYALDKFRGFIKTRVLNSQQDDKHWKTFNEHGYPCTIHYRYIAKTETATSDMQYISETKLNSKPMAHHKKSSANKSADQSEREEDLLSFFSDLPDAHKVVKMVTKKYYLDLKLFGYTTTYSNGKYYAVCTDHGEIGDC